MRKNMKGFTLVELIATIVILGLIAAVIIVNVSSISKKSTEKEYEAFREAVLSAAQAYSIKESENFNSLFIDRSFVYFTVGDLITGGYLRESLINPYTKEKIDPNGKIKAVLDSNTGSIRFDYPASNDNTEQYLVSQMDYVINGEPYDCMTGIGTYKLSLSDEDGVLITDINTLLDEYHLTCSYDPRMHVWTNTSIYEPNQVIYGDSNNQIKYSNDAGDYTITYSWITKTNTHMSATRQLRVLEKFEPSIELKAVTTSVSGNGVRPTVTEDDFGSGLSYENYDSVNGSEKIFSTYRPTYADGKWTYLAFKPILIGADLESTSFVIKKSIYKDSSHYKSISTSTTTLSTDADSYNKIYVVDDGENEYTVSTVTGGHYFKKYKLTNSSKIVVKQDIALNQDLISGSTNSFDVSKTFTISDTYSPVGIKEYEFAIGSLPAQGREAKPSSNIINRTGASTSYTYNATSNSATCAFSDKTYNTIYFRAINKDGFFGPWAQVNLYVTNNLSILIDNNKGTDCATTCSTVNSPNTKSFGNLACYYCEKVKYVKYNGKVFNVLGKAGETIIVADNEAYLGALAGTDITVEVNDVYGVQTVDGYYETNYTYTNTVAQNFFNKASLFETNFMTGGYNKVFNQALFETDNQGDYLGYSAIPTESDVTLFGNALDGEYWIAKNGTSSTFEVTVHENWQTTKSNYYWYYRKADGTLDILTGGTHNLKTMHIINKGYVCSGTGTSSDPYIISMN
ncbi:MAG: type II secretion system GspH family protein [Bacilli bacterium]|nr:type II secretion system GspH family protein [Bacilli bacterium]